MPSVELYAVCEAYCMVGVHAASSQLFVSVRVVMADNADQKCFGVMLVLAVAAWATCTAIVVLTPLIGPAPPWSACVVPLDAAPCPGGFMTSLQSRSNVSESGVVCWTEPPCTSEYDALCASGVAAQSWDGVSCGQAHDLPRTPRYTAAYALMIVLRACC